MVGSRAIPRIQSSLRPRLLPDSALQSHISRPRSSQAHIQTNAPTINASFSSPACLSSFRPLLPRSTRYSRYERRSYSSSPSDSPPIPDIVKATIGLCCGIFLLGSYAIRDPNRYSLRSFFKRNMVLTLKNWREGRYWTIITSSFTHVNLLHLGVNMFTLYSIGPMIVGIYGVTGYVLTWIGSSMACCGFSLYWDTFKEEQEKRPKSEQPLQWMRQQAEGRPHQHQDTASAGASGSVLGFSTALARVAPWLTIQVFPIPIPIYLWVFNGLLAGGSVYCMFAERLPALGHAGHLGGMMGGYACGHFLLRRMLLRR